MISLLWLRRDLRLEDNLSLYLSLQTLDKVQPIFIFDENILEKFKNPNDRRISFILDALRAINKKLQKHDSELLVFYGDPTVLIPKISSVLKANKIFAGKDYEPYGMKRDEAISKQVDLVLTNDHLLMPPDKVLKDDGTTYKMFTPYFKKWQERINLKDYDGYNIDDQGRYANSKILRDILIKSDLHSLDLNEDVPGYKYQRDVIWPVDNLVNRFNNFLDYKLINYSEGRNYLDIDGTSRLSPYIRFGLISIRQCYRSARDMNGSWQWIAELAWRDFYAMILYHYPETISKEMQPQYRNLKWSEDQDLLQKFTLAQTGYPIIDAAVRQLLQEGWMHNRTRMIVASFFTKNLWLNWRLGEEFFSQYLMDYELSSNVGGWQWSASTGTDSQPYFRMFNPYLQSKRFDKEGVYIRKYLPELKGLSNKEIHMSGLCSPIVDYVYSRKNAIERFKAI
jgi:deoxyribodipyrimidine photo-lyase